MELSFVPPQTMGEWLSFASAAAAILIGLLHLLVPRRMAGLTAFDRELVGGPAEGLIRSRAGGFPIGFGLAAIALAQPLIYLALGAAWLLAAVGRLVALVSGPARGRQAVLLIVELALAAAALAGPLGYV